MAVVGITMPVAKSVVVARPCAAALAAGAICDELSLLSALAECLLIRPGITVADKASAVNASVESDFFIVGILYVVRTLSEKNKEVRFVKGRFFTTKIYICCE